MKPILIHLHIYYFYLYPELMDYIKKIKDRKFDLFVTISNQNQKIIDDIKLNFPSAHIDVVENRGYDVGPFIEVINSVNLDNYSFVLKLHTKRNIQNNFSILANGTSICGNRWRKNLLSFMDDWDETLDILEKNKNVGMVCGRNVLLNDREDRDEINTENLDNICKKIGFSIPKKYSFVAGTMFIARSEIFKPLQGKFKFEDFEKPQKNPTLAHYIERIFGILVTSCGYKILAIKNKFLYYVVKDKIEMIFAYFSRFLFQKKITTSGKTIIKIFKIPVYIKINSNNNYKKRYFLTEFNINSDGDKGNLVFIENNRQIPFEIKRVYYIWGIKKDFIRGKHSHKNLKQMIICVKGSCDFNLDDGVTLETIHLNSPNQGLYLCNNIWREFTNFSDDCVLMVLASNKYDKKDYIRNYYQFLNEVKNDKYYYSW